jgi:hypothetical protein
VEVQVPELPQVETVLADIGRATRGSASTPRELRVRLSLGEPLAVPMTAEFAAGDAALRTFVEGEAAISRYWLVHLACTFSPPDDERLERAWLSVSLSRDDDGTAAPRPIAWSMNPMRLERPVQHARALKVGANAKLVEASLDAGRTITGGAVYLEALNVQEPTPSWEFHRTDADEIRGSFQLALVVRAPREAGVDGTVELTATIRTRRFGLLAVRAEVPDRPAVGFRL